MTKRSFLTASTFLLITSVITSFVNYLFQIITARFLNIESYGILQSVLNVVSITTAATVIINLQVTRSLSKALVDNNKTTANYLVSKVNKLIITIGIIVCILFFISTLIKPLYFGNIKSEFTLTVIILTLLSFFLAVSRALMRASLNFLQLSINTNFYSLSRTGVVLLFLMVGLKLQGVFWALVISLSVTYFLSLWQTRFVLKGAKKSIDNLYVKLLTKDSLKILVGFLGLTSLVSLDLILVQIFLPSQAGLYAGIGLFGKVIIFATTPISAVLFPYIARIKKQNNRGLFYLALVLVILISIPIIALYRLAPEFIIIHVVSKTYLPAGPFLYLYSLSIFMYSISYVIVHGFIAMNRFFPIFAVAFAALAQGLGILFFHSSINDVIYISLAATSILTVILITYMLKTLGPLFFRY